MMQPRMHLHFTSWRENLHLGWRVLAQHRVEAGVVAGVAVLLLCGSLYLHFRKKPSPEEIERRRCLRLVQVGRLVDGTIVETGEHPEGVVMFTYRVAGVQYTCAQDLSTVPNTAGNFRVDLPVQVRYDPRNPFNSIVAAETWSGLRLT
ncbi:DUF3592 domain-containing protein [Terriglobus saanensis]|uniref:DUF3592 domain-containing protein n=1 Tax=Terriglobus saanensis (strain ATCC BAA-1853 / DSM 23119 / SP1PR4) TaxID=401053 RepID=E8UZ38_TERSS|nr:hypothetical protein [Terriglobus saanensis]ADV80983.1 hypothetical protein AciPR4_0142 [Terriglobus saanensis SP1PR4]